MPPAPPPRPQLLPQPSRTGPSQPAETPPGRRGQEAGRQGLAHKLRNLDTQEKVKRQDPNWDENSRSDLPVLVPAHASPGAEVGGEGLGAEEASLLGSQSNSQPVPSWACACACACNYLRQSRRTPGALCTWPCNPRPPSAPHHSLQDTSRVTGLSPQDSIVEAKRDRRSWWGSSVLAPAIREAEHLM